MNRAAADAQLVRGVRRQSKVVVLPMSEFPAAALRAVRRWGVVTLSVRKYLPPLETILPGALPGRASAASPARIAPGEPPPGEVGTSNTRLSGQIGQPTPANRSLLR